MTATNHTEHYDLSQFVNTDHPAQYSDDDNIVRAGTPARNTESEETSQ